MQVLDLSDNMLEGSLSALSAISTLYRLRLSYNVRGLLNMLFLECHDA